MSPFRRLASTLLAVFFLALFAPGCTPESKPREATDAELDYTDMGANGQPLTSQESRRRTDRNQGAQDKPAPETKPGAPRPSPTPEPSPTPGADGLPSPEAEGPPITVIYVCEIRDNERNRPAAAIFSSDPESPYMNERPRPSRILKPMRWGKVVHLLADLKAAGFSSLPVEEQKPDETIDGTRQIILIQDGKRSVYRKSACKTDKDLYLAFARCERVLVTYSAGSDTFYETEGLHPAPTPPGH